MYFDHIAISGETRALAQAHVEAALGVPLQTGGAHPHFGTHNALLGLADGLYLEAIAIDPGAPQPSHARWFGLDNFSGPPRLTNWICRVDDLEAVVAELPEAGEIVALTRGDLRWRMAVPSSGLLPFDNMFPALIQWDCPHPAPGLTQQGVTMTGLWVSHPEAEALAERIKPFCQDDLVSLVEGPVGLEATFETPSGPVALR